MGYHETVLKDRFEVCFNLQVVVARGARKDLIIKKIIVVIKNIEGLG